jgi:serpin B
VKAILPFITTVALLLGAQPNFGADANLSNLAAANNDFAFKLLKQIAAEQNGASIFISPYSAATALQMVGNGAAGQTKAEMQQVLGTAGLSIIELNQASKAAADLINSSDTNLILTTANALWYRQGVALKSSFTNANGKFFAATVKALNFDSPPAAERVMTGKLPH